MRKTSFIKAQKKDDLLRISQKVLIAKVGNTSPVLYALMRHRLLLLVGKGSSREDMVLEEWSTQASRGVINLRCRCYFMSRNDVGML